MTNDLKPDPLRDLARDLPWDKPSDARRDAVRSSLLVEAAEGRVGDALAGSKLAGSSGLAGSRRWLTIGGAFSAGALAAAAIAVMLLRRDRPIELPAPSQITASSEAKLEHRVVATDTGVDEIVEVHAGKVTLAVPPVRRGDHVRVRTTTADVEGDAGELEVVVVADALQSVTVHAGTARISAAGQAPVFLAAGQTWHSAVITADLMPDNASKHDPARAPAIGISASGATDEGAAKPNATNEVAPSADTVKTAPVDTVKTAPVDTVKTAPVDTLKTTTRVEPKTASKSVDPSSLDPSSADPKSVDPKSVDPKSVDPKSVDPKSVSVDPKPVDPKSVSVDPKPVDPKSDPKVPATSKPAAATDRSKQAAVEKQFQQGWALLKEGKAREAATILGAAADAMPETPLAQDARYFQAVALVRAGDVAAAEKVLVQFLDHAPKSLRRGRAAVLLGRVLAIRGDRASARAWFESAVTDPDPGIAAAARAGLQSLAAK